MLRRDALVVLGLLAGLAAPSAAQLRAPRATLTPTADPATVRPGRTAKLVLTVVLPDPIHVQSDKPRDPTLFPTALVLAPPAGVTVNGTLYPKAIDFRQDGQPEPLAVFEKTFTVTATVAVAASVKPGALVVPGRFDYQACDDKVCFPPVSVPLTWNIAVRPLDRERKP